MLRKKRRNSVGQVQQKTFLLLAKTLLFHRLLQHFSLCLFFLVDRHCLIILFVKTHESNGKGEDTLFLRRASFKAENENSHVMSKKSWHK